MLLRTAFSAIVREAGDLSAGVFDRQGNMLAQAVTGTPGHVNSMAESVKHFLRAFPIEAMRAGDIYITNDPWMGTGHLNDFVLTTQAFHRGKPVGLFSCTSHLMDIGGVGFGPDGTDVFMEGLYIPLLKLADSLGGRLLLLGCLPDGKRHVDPEAVVVVAVPIVDIAATVGQPGRNAVAELEFQAGFYGVALIVCVRVSAVTPFSSHFPLIAYFIQLATARPDRRQKDEPSDSSYHDAPPGCPICLNAPQRRTHPSGWVRIIEEPIAKFRLSFS